MSAFYFSREKNDFEEANQRVCEETDGTKNYNETIRRTSAGKKKPDAASKSASIKARRQNAEELQFP